ncbi:undecaprenyl-phosphate glucose phosphotransferase [Rhizobium sp. Root274]|uniref:undecaprenyl-phosphate glucose phosphotransferase n=1 Tax=unclassified Rhizobium TaxID=2613769 RepID=UPI00071549FB|nr:MULTISPECIES: undecaprenyl-phosphate glucose phosphotransferase [unclassified Rhizobium]KQW30919.1 undecaprenyl-phosphate glucose phosphotransferase [Rhizobium sp. Root1240]KRD32463.1 undecaprenyl-phosphate glucose phosphotransferase [Rhizobium sp. Root274]
MNKVDKPDAFDLEALRRKPAMNADGTAPGPGSEPKAEVSALARQIASQYAVANYSPSIIIGQLRFLEFLSLFAIALAANYFMALEPGAHFVLSAISGFGGALLALTLMQASDCYHVSILRTPMRSIARVLISWTVAVALTSLATLLFGDFDVKYPSTLTVWFVVGGAFLVIERNLIGFAIRRWGRNGVMERRAVIVGGGKPAKDLIRALEQQPENDIRICGIFDDRNSQRSPDVVAGYPKLGTVAELVEFARLAHIDMLIISLPLSAEARIMELLRMLWVLPVDVRLAAHSNNLRFRPRSYSHVGAVPLLDILDKPIRDWDSVAKRAFDIVFSLLALVLLWPVFIATAIAVKTTSKGPVFFVQKRHGFNNEVINVLKFRSMYTEMSDPTARNAVTRGDPRVTKVGRFIRKTSIDELPQIFNVLRGDLSLVGPRPHAVLGQTRDKTYGEIVEGYFARHRVKPGVTGWAQINGWRGEIDTDEKIKFRTAFDLYYIENWSLLFDLKILFLTPIKLLNTENAY